MSEKKLEKKLDQAAEAVADTGSEQEDILLDHEYDGIREYDNPLPKWWTSIFWGTVVFSVGYLVYYHVGHGASREDEFAQDMKEAKALEAKRLAKEKVTEDMLAKLAGDSAAVSEGKKIYDVRCASCHADKGQGLVGPNLTDPYWIHGKGTLMGIYQVASEGVVDKGMPAWRKQLSPLELRQVVAYVGTLRGKNVAGKEPQGEKVTEN